MGINLWGVVYGTMAFLPYLRKRPEGHVINISSINGIMPNPNNGPYCTAKFAVKGYTETLAQEMHGTNINVSCVHPGGIKTNIARNSRFNCAMYSLSREKSICLYEDELFRTTADEAARVIISGIKRNKRRILIGMDAKVIDLITRFFPVTAVKLTTICSRFIARTYARK
jgi:short-subunit dehydrogenase